MPAFIDLTGKRFHRRVVLELVHRNGAKNAMWKVKCDCGTIQILPSQNVRRNHSCGCYSREQARARVIKPTGEAARNSLFIRHKWNAKLRELEFALSLEECERIWKSSCHYCGIEPSQVSKNDLRRFNGGYVFNGIDRKDNTKGYTIENCLPCCKFCNYLKRAHPYDVFVEHILRMSRQLTEVKYACAS